MLTVIVVSVALAIQKQIKYSPENKTRQAKDMLTKEIKIT
jgi:hypothetical protein